MSLTIKDALTKAKSDPAFAKTLVGDPASLKTQYGLSDTQVTHLKSLGTQASKVSVGLVSGLHSNEDYD